MSQRKFISRFTPSRTDPAALEQILVQRHDLLDDAVARVRESATTGNKHHLLFVGPRGSGKTNLVTLLFHRIDQQAHLHDRLRIAWLNEDETSTTFLDLLLRIYRALEKKYPAEFSLEALESLYGSDLSVAADQLGALLLSRLADRPLLVLVENLSDLFDSLGDAGQKSWRAFVQNHPVFTIVGTAQRLFDGITRRTSPFFGFFQTEHLRPLTVSDAITLLEKIAALNNDKELGEFLRSRVGRARVRALHHLTGGNHRIYVVLSEFITRESIDQLVRPFESMIDELTPYYQERIRWLAPLQRKIVEHLCSRARPTPVKDIAKALFSSHQTIASQLKALRALGYVESHARGRESLYEMSEPLMRLCVEVKENQQRKPLRLIVDFLRVWYDTNKPESHLAALPAGAPERPCVADALEHLRTQAISLRLQFLLDDLDRINPEAPGPERLQCLREVVGERGTDDDWFELLQELVAQDKWEETLNTVQQARRSNVAKSDEAQAILTFAAGGSLLVLNRPQEALTEFSQVISNPHAHSRIRISALILRGKASLSLGDNESALTDFEQSAKAPEGRPIDRADALTNYSSVLMTESRWPEGFRALESAFQNSVQRVTRATAPIAEMLKAILQSGRNDKSWRPRAAEITRIFAQHDSLPALGENLVRNLPLLAFANLNETGLDAWATLWHELGAAHDALAVPLRLMRTGIEFLKNKDESVFFDLPKEERAILRQTFFLSTETEEA